MFAGKATLRMLEWPQTLLLMLYSQQQSVQEPQFFWKTSQTPILQMTGTSHRFSGRRQGHGFIIISDCLPLVNVINGHRPLATPTLQALFHRVSGNIVLLFHNGLRPYQTHKDHVVWRRRDRNKKADFLVNHTMDIEQSWHKCYPTLAGVSNPMSANFILHFDGGTRGDKCSASAWILEAKTVIEQMK